MLTRQEEGGNYGIQSSELVFLAGSSNGGPLKLSIKFERMSRAQDHPARLRSANSPSSKEFHWASCGKTSAGFARDRAQPIRVRADAEIFELEIQAPQFYPSRPHRCNRRCRRLLSLRGLMLLVVFFRKFVATVGVSRIDFGFAERGIEHYPLLPLITRRHPARRYAQGVNSCWPPG